MGIECVDLYAGYRRGKWVLNGISLKIERNTILLGPNGSGKTTLFRAIMGLSVISRGKVLIDGVEVDKIRSKPGLMATNLQEIKLPLSISVREMVGFYLDVMGGDYDLFLKLIDIFEAGDALNKKFYELSSGYRVLVMNAFALASKAKYILLDEPFENLDPRRRALVLKETLSHNSIIIMNTHMTWMLKHLKDWNCYLLVSGKTYSVGSVEDLLSMKITSSKTPDSVLEIKVGDTSIYLSKTTGMELSSIDTLDNLYEKLFITTS